MKASLLYNIPPPEGKLNGVAVDANSPGVAPFTFHAQHGFAKSEVAPHTLTGFSPCTTPVQLTLHNARTVLHPPKLPTHGFQLLIAPRATLPLNVRDDPHAIRELYSEAEEIARVAFPDAVTATAFNHVYRISGRGASTKPRHTEGVSSPSYMVHSDSTDASWPSRLRELVSGGEWALAGPSHLSPAQGKELASSHRVVVLNLWRLVANFKQPSPSQLAVCDMRSVSMRSALPYHFVVDGFIGWNYGLNKDSAAEHDWYYYPELAADEVIAFKAYDSKHEASGGREYCFHAAFDDPTAPVDCAPRESVEIRVALAFAPQHE
ncbi:MAG: hypothetical protein SGPRY_009542 [Prymnesium sp.]